MSIRVITMRVDRTAFASVARIVLVLLALAGGWRWAAEGPAVQQAACCTGSEGLQVAPAGVAPLVWYDAANPPPPLTDQIAGAASSFGPGHSVSMVAYVRNTGTASGTPTIAIEDLVGSAVLAECLHLTITYSSSLAPSRWYLVATGTLADLAATRPALAAPVKLRPYSGTCAEVGTWRLVVTLPADAGNETQLQAARCAIRFGLYGGGGKQR